MYDGMSMVMWSKKGRPSHRERPSHRGRPSHRERPSHRRRPPHHERLCPTGSTYSPVRHKGVRDDGIAPHTQRVWCATWECRNQDIFICFKGQPQTSQARSIGVKIGINTLFFRYPASGSGQYLLHLLQALAEVDQQNRYVLLGPEPSLQGNSTPDTFPYQVAPIPGFATRNASIEKLVWEQFTAPPSAHRAGADLYHVPYFAPPYFPRIPGVVTIHDVIPLRLPAYRASTRTKAYTQLIARAAHKATLIITISQHAKQDMIDALKLPAERIRVIYEAAGDEYQPVTDPATLAKQ